VIYFKSGYLQQNITRLYNVIYSFIHFIHLFYLSILFYFISFMQCFYLFLLFHLFIMYTIITSDA